jgi:hypothetical protein
MPRLRIDIEDLTVAMSDHDSEWVLDLQTGATLLKEWIRDPELRGDLELGLDEDGDLDDEFGDLDDEFGELDPLESGRFVSIEPIPSHQGFRWMEDFAREQQDERVRRRLLDALDRPRPFRSFKDALHELGPVRDAWYAYQEEQLRACARAWVEARELDAELFEGPRPPAA